jgi:alkylated DNA repair dioxygenase AlkB
MAQRDIREFLRPVSREARRDEPPLALSTGVPGMTLVLNAITRDEEEMLRQCVYAAQWSRELARRTQQYGPRFDYATHKLKTPRVAMPPWAYAAITALYRANVYGAHEPLPRQLIVNEYEPGQGIGMHVDDAVFGEPVVSLSLCARTSMDFDCGGARLKLDLPRRSALVLRDAARCAWRHGIAARRVDVRDDGSELARETRVSLTFRTVAYARPLGRELHDCRHGRRDVPAHDHGEDLLDAHALCLELDHNVQERCVAFPHDLGQPRGGVRGNSLDELGAPVTLDIRAERELVGRRDAGQLVHEPVAQRRREVGEDRVAQGGRHVSAGGKIGSTQQSRARARWPRRVRAR